MHLDLFPVHQVTPRSLAVVLVLKDSLHFIWCFFPLRELYYEIVFVLLVLDRLALVCVQEYAVAITR